MTDTELCERAAAGDAKAWQELTCRFGKLVRSVVSKKASGEQHLRDDIEQDAWLLIYEKIGGYDPKRGELGPWIATLATEVSCGHRAGWRRRESSRNEEPIGVPMFAGGGVTLLDTFSYPDAPRVDDLAHGNRMRSEMRAAVRSVCSRVSPERGQVITMAYCWGMAGCDIARKLGVTRAAVSLHMVAARRLIEEELRKRLGT